jgi:hypothetical protein
MAVTLESLLHMISHTCPMIMTNTNYLKILQQSLITYILVNVMYRRIDVGRS